MANVYLACFIIGFVLTATAFVMGLAGDSFGHHAHFGHGGDIGHGGHAAVAGGDTGADGSANPFHRARGVSLVNFGTVMAFLTWFGGVGFLLTAYSAVLAAITVAIAVAGGVAGAGAIFLFMAKVLAPDQIPLDPADYHLPGMLGRVTVTIPPDGTGEIVYSQGGSRKTLAARGAERQGIAKGTEVVVMRYEHGIAYVRPWEQLAEGHAGDRASSR